MRVLGGEGGGGGWLGGVVGDRTKMLLQEGNGVHYNISGARQHLVVNTPLF